MYGYFDTVKAYLRNNELSVFNSYYCRLCYCLWNKGGQPTRYLTTYDATVYNLIVAIAGGDERPPFFSCERVKTNHKNYYKDDKVGNLIADLSLIGFAIKIKDNETDGDKAKAFFANLLFGRVIKKAIDRNKELYEKSYESILAMDALQQSGASLEVVLEAYGEALVYGFKHLFDIGEKYLHLIKLVARWVFLIDMFDDYNDDVKKKRPNTLIKEGCNTISELFDKYYWEIVPFVRREAENMKKALCDIRDDSSEWVILNKILRHSLATLVPAIINGEDVSYHYFRHTCVKDMKSNERKRILKKYEKDTANNKSN